MSDSLGEELHAKIEMLTPSMKARLNGYADRLLDSDQDDMDAEELKALNKALNESEEARLAGKTSDAFEFAEELQREFP